MTIWVARDKNGDLFLHELKPYRYERFEIWRNDGDYQYIITGVTGFLGNSFENLTWESEPIEIEMVVVNSETKIT